MSSLHDGSVRERESSGEQQVSRVELVAALLEYDEEPSETWSAAALTSAILSPYRHILLPDRMTRSRETTAPVQELDDFFETLVVSSNAPDGRPRRDPRDASFHDRYASHFDQLDFNDHQIDTEMSEEWGLREHLSLLKAGDDLDGYKMLPIDSKIKEETRSLPELFGPRTTTFSNASTSALAAAAAIRSSPTQLHIIEKPVGWGRPRTKSLGQHQAVTVLPDFDNYLMQEKPDVLLARPRIRRTSTAEMNESGLQTRRSSGDTMQSRPQIRRSSTAETNPRWANRSRRGSMTGSRRLSTSAVSIATMMAQNPAVISRRASPTFSTFSTPLTNSRMSISGDSMLDTQAQPFDPRAASPSWTSRFDPNMLLAARAAEKDRAVFSDPEGGKPKMILMPTPLAGRGPDPYKRVRTEGPEVIVSGVFGMRGDAMEDIEEQHIVRPAGMLFGKSLLDVLSERQDAMKAKQRHYIPGNDGRRSMMDWGKPKAMSNAVEETDPAKEILENGEGLMPPPKMPRSRSTMSVFGPDLLYAADLEKLRAMEREEEIEKAKITEKDAMLLEKERLKEEKKTAKNRTAAARKLEGMSPKRSFEGPLPRQFEGPMHGHSKAPSLSLPLVLAQPEDLDTTRWFAPPSPPAGEQPFTPYERSQSPFLPALSTVEHTLVVEQHDAGRSGRATPIEADRPPPTHLKHSSTFSEDYKLYSEGFGADDGQGPARVGVDNFGNRIVYMSMQERLNVDKRASTPYSERRRQAMEEEEEDNVPLGLRHPEARGRVEDDDVPLAFVNRATVISGDEDDQPLEYVHPGALYAQQSHHDDIARYEWEQQQHYQMQMAQQHQQQQMAMMMQMQHFQQSQQMMNGGMEQGGGVARWRQDVYGAPESSTSRS